MSLPNADVWTTAPEPSVSDVAEKEKLVSTIQSLQDDLKTAHRTSAAGLYQGGSR
ncbi:hypothetical protein MVES_000313 [Malassezia vespertilionis]|uniref:Uncharacterized protein n=1 Tax=Malassezia vespertilionis TaxID=2020962 RepID=A0A2N1JFL7_9BASI|nr:hypothetical protein MVES_000313 [Malassezia vespertilionis]